MKEYKLVRSTRKTVAILVHPDGSVIVRAPHKVPLNQIQAFVDLKAGWIAEKKELVRRKRESLPAPRQFAEGETFLYLGKAYPLALSRNGSKSLKLEGEHFLLRQSDLGEARDAFTRWYIEQARAYLTGRVEELANHYGLTYDRIRITSARTRWGSCSSTGTISFTWRLIMAPPEVVDYVVIHELAHTLEPNHSQRFWQRVAAMDTGYAKHRKWLKEHGHKLVLE